MPFTFFQNPLGKRERIHLSKLLDHQGKSLSSTDVKRIVHARDTELDQLFQRRVAKQEHTIAALSKTIDLKRLGQRFQDEEKSGPLSGRLRSLRQRLAQSTPDAKSIHADVPAVFQRLDLSPDALQKEIAIVDPSLQLDPATGSLARRPSRQPVSPVRPGPAPTAQTLVAPFHFDDADVDKRGLTFNRNTTAEADALIGRMFSRIQVSSGVGSGFSRIQLGELLVIPPNTRQVRVRAEFQREGELKVPTLVAMTSASVQFFLQLIPLTGDVVEVESDVVDIFGYLAGLGELDIARGVQILDLTYTPPSEGITCSLRLIASSIVVTQGLLSSPRAEIDVVLKKFIVDFVR